MYTAVVLSNTSRNSLINKFSAKLENLQKQGYVMRIATGPLVHHVTLHMGVFDSAINDKSLLGKEIEFFVNSFAFDLKVAAFGVEHVPYATGSLFGNLQVYSSNNQPHVTALVNPINRGKPFDSNKLTDWEPIERFKISGILETVT